MLNFMFVFQEKILHGVFDGPRVCLGIVDASVPFGNFLPSDNGTDSKSFWIV
jgi:hypothetical protein